MLSVPDFIHANTSFVPFLMISRCKYIWCWCWVSTFFVLFL